MMDSCQDCSGTDFVEYQGDYTCKSCGLVQFSGIIDDRAEWRTYDDQDKQNIRTEIMFDNSYTRTGSRRLDRLQQKIVKKVSKQQVLRNKIKLNVERLFGDDSLMRDYAVNLLSLVEREPWLYTSSQTQGILALCVYCANIQLKRGYHPLRITNVFGIDVSVLWITLQLVSKYWTSQNWYRSVMKSLSSHTDQLTRKVYGLEIIPADKTWRVLKQARQIHDKVHKHPTFTSFKSSSLHVCCIYIACMVSDVIVDRIELCKKMGISVSTLKHHESLIQRVLMQNSGNSECQQASRS